MELFVDLLINIKDTKIRCSVESTGGSVYNVNTIKNQELDFGIVQSDIVYQASKGEGAFQGAAVSKIKNLLWLYIQNF